MRGKFIVFEGIDNAGKTTMIDLLLTAMKYDGFEFVSLKFPNPNGMFKNILQMYKEEIIDINPRSAHLLHSADRWNCVDYIKETLKNGVNIVCDRYFYSGIAYSCGVHELDFEWACQSDIGMIKPDIVFYLDVDVVNAKQRGYFGDRYENIDQLKRVRKCYLQMYEDKWVIVDANKPKENVFEHVKRTVYQLIE